MRKFWLCLAASLLLHAVFFPDFLQALLSSTAAGKPESKPRRVSIRLAPKPAKVVEVKPKPVPPKRTKPKVVPPKRQARVLPPPKAAVARPVPPPKAAPPVRSLPPRTTPPRSKPPANLTHYGGSQPRPSTRRLASTAPATSRSTFSPPRSPSEGETSGSAGVVPERGAEVPTGPPEGDGNGDGPPGPADSGQQPSGPPPSEPSAQPVEPSPTPTPPPPKPNVPQERPKRSASAAPKAREATISVPSSIRLPANLRRDSLKVSLQVRAVIEGNGSVDFKLGETSGNADVDDYVLGQLRSVAEVTPALDDQGQPKRSMKRVRVDIEVQ